MHATVHASDGGGDGGGGGGGRRRHRCRLRRRHHLLSPLCGVFTLRFLKQTMALGNTVLQLFCSYYSRFI